MDNCNCRLDLSLPITCDGCNGPKVETIEFTPYLKGYTTPGEYTYGERRGTRSIRGDILFLQVLVEVTGIVNPGSGVLYIAGIPDVVDQKKRIVNSMFRTVGFIPEGYTQVEPVHMNGRGFEFRAAGPGKTELRWFLASELKGHEQIGINAVADK